MSGLVKLFILALFLAAGGWLMLTQQSTPEAAVAAPAAPTTVEVRVAARDLHVGALLESADAPFAAIPEAEFEQGMVTAEGDDALGAVVIAPMRAGAPLRRHALLAPGQEGFLAAVLSRGMRAVSVGVDAVSGAAGLIFPGDRVDVLLTQRVDGEDDDAEVGLRWASETILRNARVIAVDQNLKTDLTERDATAVARTITLEVTPAEAEVIAVARNLGALSMTLRSIIVEGELQDEPRIAPTWAGDISEALRVAAGRDAEPGSGAAPTAPPRVMVLRGARGESIVEAQP